MTEVFLGSALIVALMVGLSLGLLAARRRLVPQGAIDVVVNAATHLAGARGDRLLQVLQGGGIRIPAACGGAGTCGLCRVTVIGEGAGEPQATERGVLSARERRAHVRLACQTRLRGDCEVVVPDAVFSAGSGLTCKVASARMLAPLIREIVLDLPDGQPFSFRAGSFMQLTAPPFELDLGTLDLPDDIRRAWEAAGWSRLKVSSETPVTRAYSLANRTADAGRAVFNIRLAVPPAGREQDIPPGVVSSWLFSVQAGDEVAASGPFGDFQVQPTERDMIFVGGGVGMAPLRAMINEQLGSGTVRNVLYFYGARTASDLYYVEEFDDLAARHANFTWVPALSDPAPGDRWTGRTGFIHHTVRSAMEKHPAPEDCEYYLCGPPVMISAVLATLEGLGASPDLIFHDDFGE